MEVYSLDLIFLKVGTDHLFFLGRGGVFFSVIRPSYFSPA